MPRLFPPGFVWGTATAAYQIEGAVHEDGRGESIWDRFSHTPGKTRTGDTGDIACDHYHRWRDDIALMADLGQNGYRFSVAWPRIVPMGVGAVNPAGLDFYDRLVDGLLAAGITPFVTLYHWDLPQPLEDAGGWPQRATADAFAAYADVVTRRLGDRVKRWITLNEPWCSAFLGYHTGEHAPGRTSLPDALAAAHTLLLAHGKAMTVIRANVPDAQAGITVVLSPGYPADDSAGAAAAAQRYDGLYNRWWLDPIAGRGYPADMLAWWAESLPTIAPEDLATIAAPIDFLGVNYYFPRRLVERDPGDAGRPRELAAPDLAMLRASDVPIPDVPYTAANWPVYPQALTDLLLRLTREYPFRAIVITENGAAFHDPDPVDGRVPDPDRTRYFAAHLGAILDAIDGGAPVRGYFAWSLYDNFEWAMGYGLRFGVCYTDYPTQRRIVKDSGHYLRRVAQANALLDPE